jgi:hypothetical protein
LQELNNQRNDAESNLLSIFDISVILHQYLLLKEDADDLKHVKEQIYNEIVDRKGTQQESDVI